MPPVLFCTCGSRTLRIFPQSCRPYRVGRFLIARTQRVRSRPQRGRKSFARTAGVLSVPQWHMLCPRDRKCRSSFCRYRWRNARQGTRRTRSASCCSGAARADSSCRKFVLVGIGSGPPRKACSLKRLICSGSGPLHKARTSLLAHRRSSRASTRCTRPRKHRRTDRAAARSDTWGRACSR